MGDVRFLSLDDCVAWVRTEADGERGQAAVNAPGGDGKKGERKQGGH